MAGFKEARGKLIQALRDGTYQHYPRTDEEANQLMLGNVSDEQVVNMLRVCRGSQYNEEPWHDDDSLNVHIFKPEIGSDTSRVQWYIKAVIKDPDTIIISVHKSRHQS